MTTKTVTLTEFLLARIAEDREAAGQAKWAMQDEWFTEADDKVDEYVRRLSPTRVLAECEAKRRIMEWHPVYRGPRLVAVDRRPAGFACEQCHATSSISEQSVIEDLGWCETLRLLALPYADHPDYDEAWQA